MHIIAGNHKGLKLKVPKTGVRPMTDRVKTRVFQILENYDAIEDATVLDLFGGSGALSLESISRGAKIAYINDISDSALKFIKQNVEPASKKIVIAKKDALKFTKVSPIHPFDIIFLDPPFDFETRKVDQIIANLVANSFFSGSGILVTERRRNSDHLTYPEQLESIYDKTLGDIVVNISQLNTSSD